MLSSFVVLLPSVSMSGEFELLSRTLLQEVPREALFAGDKIILASGGALAVIDDPSAPSAFRLVALEGEPYDIAAKGDVIYAAAWGLGIVTVDLGDPANPAIADSRPLPQATHCCVCGDLLVVADVERGVVTFDISKPLKPALTSFAGVRSRPVSLLSADEIVVIVDGGGATVFSAAKDGILTRQSHLESPGAKKQAYLHRDILYLNASGGTFVRYDISDPAILLELAPLPLDGIGALAFFEDRGLALTNDGKMIPFTVPGAGDKYGAIRAADPLPADYRRLSAEDLPVPGQNPVKRITNREEKRRFPGSSPSMSGNWLACMDEREGFWIYDLRGGGASCTGKVTATGFATDLVARDGYLYLANGRDGLRIGKVSTSGSVEWTGHLRTAVARDVALAGDILLVADGDEGLRTVDISDPSRPRELGHVKSPFYLSAVVAEGSTAFLAGGLGGTEIVDFSDPEKPRLVWRAGFSEVRGIFADRKYFYFADGFNGFKIYSRGGEVPRLVSMTDTPGWACDVFVDGDLLYIAVGGDGLRVVDIGDRSKPVMLGSVSIGSIAREIHAAGKTVFIASQKNGIAAVDVSDPRKPFIAASHPSVDDGRGVFEDGRFVYLASGSGGVYIFRYNVK